MSQGTRVFVFPHYPYSRNTPMRLTGVFILVLVLVIVSFAQVR